MSPEPISAAYGPTILSFGAMGGMLLLQLIVADVAGIRAKHAPGTPVEPDPSHFLFRAVRAHANTNESIAAFVLLALCCALVGANPGWTNGASVVFVVARVGHMLCYWAGLGLARSASFGVAALALVALAVNALVASI